MKYETQSWEEGTIRPDPKHAIDYPCVFATVLCTPHWFKRWVFRKKPWTVDVYGQKIGQHYEWHNAHTGKELERYLYEGSLRSHMYWCIGQIREGEAATYIRSQIKRAVKK